MKIESLNLRLQDVTELKEWFSDYVKGFNLEKDEWQQNIELKKQHTLRVCEEILAIGSELKLNESDLLLAEILALFHDIGRFEQYEKYKTFVDGKSENHAELGIRVLHKMNVLKDLDQKVQYIINRAIGYHNRATLPEDEDVQILFFSKLLRDADKLDIYRVVTDYYQQAKTSRNSAIELDLPDSGGISYHVYQSLLNHQIVMTRHLSNLNDFKLLQVGWIFDVNFSPTLRIVKKHNYLQKIRDALPNSPQINSIFNEVKSYLDEHT